MKFFTLCNYIPKYVYTYTYALMYLCYTPMLIFAVEGLKTFFLLSAAVRAYKAFCLNKNNKIAE